MGTTVVEGVVAATKERRVVVVPSSQENKKLSIVTLPEPKDGKPREYAVGEGVVLEANWFRRKNASWFIGNDVVSDGGITLYTKVNPIFFVLPSLAGCGQQNMKQQNMFCTLEHILESSGLPRQETFEALLEKSLSDVCDTKEVGDEVYFRFSIDKLMGWLVEKTNTLKKVFPSINSSFSLIDEDGLQAYAVEYLGEFLPQQLLAKLRSKLNMPDPNEVKAKELIPKGNKVSHSAADPKEKRVIKTIQQVKAKKPKLKADASNLKISSFFQRK